MAASSSSSPSDNTRQAAYAPGTSQAGDHKVFAVVQQIAYPFLRISLGVVLFWIGALKYFHPAPNVALLQASFPLRFLATNGFVYVLGTLEIVAAVLLLGNIAVRYVGLLVVLAGAALTLSAHDAERHANQSPDGMAEMHSEVSDLRRRMDRMEQGR